MYKKLIFLTVIPTVKSLSTALAVLEVRDLSGGSKGKYFCSLDPLFKRFTLGWSSEAQPRVSAFQLPNTNANQQPLL